MCKLPCMGMFGQNYQEPRWLDERQEKCIKDATSATNINQNIGLVEKGFLETSLNNQANA